MSRTYRTPRPSQTLVTGNKRVLEKDLWWDWDRETRIAGTEVVFGFHEMNGNKRDYHRQMRRAGRKLIQEELQDLSTIAQH